MTIATSPTQPLLLDVSTTTLTVTQEQFLSLSIQNPDLRLELTPNRELIVMPPTLPISGKRNGDLSAVFGTGINRLIWVKRSTLQRDMTFQHLRVECPHLSRLGSRSLDSKGLAWKNSLLSPPTL